MEVSDQIIKVLDEVGKKFGLAIDWTQANVIPYIQQLTQRIVNYELWTSVVWIIISIGLIIFGVVVHRKRKYKNIDWATWNGLGTALLVNILILSGVVIIITQMFDIVTCLTFPEKVIFEFVQQYIH